ncbi:MAG: NADH:ubiquinone reductase (Na(+)-transporting) subunit B [Bacteroidales bacterium]|nr:NADH:ubiquinone reductase (Na(+)-transporting) subunit B [Bacteroidales bacterium]MBQ2912823.1 NADH:ubiquinone reductase (Na(+)-transporting) subunit B [Bacteroidales bacterium]MBR2477282.1 NADH:ubiquinone reductase (Na(+)-transporting) subunit B [Bacteroidales bacterium]
MKALLNLVEKIKPTFSKGGKLGFLHSTFDAFETFLFVPNTVTKSGSHIRDCVDLKRVMTVVIVALLPALAFGIWNVGEQHSIAFGLDMTFIEKVWFGFLKVLPLLIVSYVVGLGIEFISAQLRGHEVNEGFLVSGMLIPLVMPVDVPLWILALAVAFAVIIGKEVFGGTGMNIWNPALIARAFVFFAYPSQISGDTIWVEGLNAAKANAMQVVDGFTGATPLGQAANGIVEFTTTTGEPLSLMQAFIGNMPGSIGETSTIAILIGAVILIWTGVASWKIMVSCVAGALATGFLVNGFAEPGTFAAVPAYWHLVLGGFAFGAVFMATDPVTSAQTEKGKWIYGFLTGALAVIIRLFNPGYPEGMMLAILLMNTFAPLIDYYVVEGNIKKRMKRSVTK